MASPVENGNSFHPIGWASSRAAWLMDLKVRQSPGPIVWTCESACGPENATRLARPGLSSQAIKFRRRTRRWFVGRGGARQV